MSHTLLVEVGTEELPASFVRLGCESLEQAARELLKRERLNFSTLSVCGTPRRLALLVDGLAVAQPDYEEVIMGPPTRLVFDEQGKVTKQGEGFAQKYNARAESLERVTTDKGEYVSVKRSEKGQATGKVLQSLIPNICAQISFPKTMRWGEGDVAFGRPVHWLVALLDDDIVDCAFAGQKSDRKSYGHRFLSNSAFALKNAKTYKATLAKHNVIADSSERREAIRAALLQEAKKNNAQLVEDAFLEEECSNLVEEPHILSGSIEAKFLSLPEEVIIAVMRNHQRYFALREQKSGKISATYLNVVNTALNPTRIAAGNDRVLRARLADAEFFVSEDKKQTLKDRAARLNDVVWQQKLGSVGAKVLRILALSEFLSDKHKQIPNKEASLAASLCKSDLTTHIVFEFPELQGHAGRAYALAEGLKSDVADALRDHYLPVDATSSLPSSSIAIALALADRADTLVGCFGIGFKPTGSTDPYGLRRAAIALARIARSNAQDIDVALKTLFSEAFDRYDKTSLRNKSEVLTELDQFVRARLEVLFAETYPSDVVSACLAAWNGESVRDLEARMQALAAWYERPDFSKLATAFKRVFNIASDAKRAQVTPALLEAGPEQDLAATLTRIAPQLSAAAKSSNYQQALELITSELGPRVDLYFEKVFVMVDDPKLKENRLALLAQISDALTGIAHFHLLSKR